MSELNLKGAEVDFRRVPWYWRRRLLWAIVRGGKVSGPIHFGDQPTAKIRAAVMKAECRRVRAGGGR